MNIEINCSRLIILDTKIPTSEHLIIHFFLPYFLISQIVLLFNLHNFLVHSIAFFLTNVFFLNKECSKIKVVFRALGDASLKPYVSSVSDVTTVELGEKDDFLIVGQYSIYSLSIVHFRKFVICKRTFGIFYFIYLFIYFLNSLWSSHSFKN